MRDRRHCISNGRLSAFRQELGIELAVDVYETSVNLQFWKRYQDVVDLVLLAPDQSQVFRFLDSEQGVGGRADRILCMEQYRDSCFL